METTKKTGIYEFTTDENRHLTDLSRSMWRLGRATLIGGMLFVAYIVISFLDPVPLLQVTDARHMALATFDYILWIVISLLVIYLSVMLIKLTKYLRLIAETTGTDISHLMQFITGLTKVCDLSFKGLVVVCVLIGASLILMLLVF